jgi:hypothetical protein
MQVQACTDLMDCSWIPLHTTTLSGGSMDFTDPDMAAYPSRVYRIVGP